MSLLTLVLVILVIWILFSQVQRPAYIEGPYVGNGLWVLLVVIIVILLLNYAGPHRYW